MQNSESLRKHRTPAQRRALLKEFRRSQLTQQDFARQSGIGVSTLQSWLRKSGPEPGPKVPAFVALPNGLAASAAPPAYRLRWPNGLSLEFAAGFHVEDLAAVLELLRGL